MSSASETEIFVFAGYSLDARQRLLFGPTGERVPLGARAFDTLLFLAQHPNELVDKNVLMKAIWPNVVVEENNLNQNISAIRRALGESPAEHRFIVTVPGRGFRFVPAVGKLDGSLPPTPSSPPARSLPLQGSLVPQPPSPAQKVPTAAPSATFRAPRPNGARTSVGWRWRAVSFFGLVALAMAAAAFLYMHLHPARALSASQSIVIANFTNSTGDPVFDGTLRGGLAAQLEQSPSLKIVSGDQIAQTLTLMERPPDARLTHALAREVCLRANATTLIDGSIVRLGKRYVLNVSAADCRTGELLAQRQVTANGKAKILDALDETASYVRAKLGEPAASLQQHSVPLVQATTSSLEALQAFNRCEQTWFRFDVALAVTFCQRAVALDARFANAYALLGIMYSVLGDNALATRNVTKAYDLRGRASERESLAITATYDVFGPGELEKAFETAELWTQAYPEDQRAFQELGNVSRDLGRHRQALSAYRASVRLDPAAAFNYVLLASEYIRQDRMGEARSTLRQARSRGLDNPAFSELAYLMAFLRNDSAALSKLADASATWVPLGEGDFVQANTAAYAGRLALARKLSQRAIQSALQRRALQTATVYQAESALREALFGEFDRVTLAPADSERRMPTMQSQGIEALALSLAGHATQAEKIAASLNRRFPDATLAQSSYLPAIRAALALGRGSPQEAIEELRPAAAHEEGWQTNNFSSMFRMMTVYLRGQADLAAHQGAAARGEFRKILDHPGIVLNEPIGALARLGLARASALQGDRVAAKAAYRDFLDLWKDADPDIPILKQAQAEYAKLR